MVSRTIEAITAGRGYLGMASGIKKRNITTAQKINISDVSGTLNLPPFPRIFDPVS